MPIVATCAFLLSLTGKVLSGYLKRQHETSKNNPLLNQLKAVVIIDRGGPKARKQLKKGFAFIDDNSDMLARMATFDLEELFNILSADIGLNDEAWDKVQAGNFDVSLDWDKLYKFTEALWKQLEDVKTHFDDDDVADMVPTGERDYDDHAFQKDDAMSDAELSAKYTELLGAVEHVNKDFLDQVEAAAVSQSAEEMAAAEAAWNCFAGLEEAEESAVLGLFENVPDVHAPSSVSASPSLLPSLPAQTVCKPVLAPIPVAPLAPTAQGADLQPVPPPAALLPDGADMKPVPPPPVKRPRKKLPPSFSAHGLPPSPPNAQPHPAALCAPEGSDDELCAACQGNCPWEKYLHFPDDEGQKRDMQTILDMIPVDLWPSYKKPKSTKAAKSYCLTALCGCRYEIFVWQKRFKLLAHCKISDLKTVKTKSWAWKTKLGAADAADQMFAASCKGEQHKMFCHCIQGY